MNSKKLVIFGTGEIADLAYYYFTHDSEYEVVAFTADDKFISDDTHLGLPLVPFSRLTEEFPSSKFVGHVALSYMKINRIREEKYVAMKELGYTLVSYVCSKSVTWPDLSIGDNCFILENQTIQPTVTIGNNVMIWSGNHLGHGCVIKDHVYISSHVCIAGHTTIGERCFLGVNSAFKDFINVGKEVFITMGANVTSDIDDGSVIIASQGTVLGKEEKLTKKLMKKYFRLEA